MPAGAITLDDIQSADWSLMLGSSAAQFGLASGIGNVVQGIGDINQCIAIILATPKGSDPLRPTFGCDLWNWIDAPINLARPHLVREVVEALTIWEPRIRVMAVMVNLAGGDLSANVNAHLDIAITWQLKIDVSGNGSGINQRLVLTVPKYLAG